MNDFQSTEKMPTERTPLVQTVPVRPLHRRYPHQTCRRFFTVASAALLLLGFSSFVLQVFFVWPRDYPHGHHDHYTSSRKGLKLDQLQEILLTTPSLEKIEEWLYYYTAGPHLAGKNYSQAEWTRNRWASWGLDTEIVAYDVYLNYPVDASVSMQEKSEKSDDFTVSFQAVLDEDVLEDDPTTGLEDRVPVFHGYAASGNVTGSFVYVNYGSYQDFEDLVKLGVPLEGKIAIARYGLGFRGLKVKRAQELGMTGILIYSDPGDDGEITEENGYKPYPEGPARNPSSVQRGSVEFISVRPGDPTTPGYPSKPGAPRAPVDGAVPYIPSIPISYADALPILKTLNGHGPKASDLNKYWNRNLGLGYKGVNYNIGPSPDNVVVNLYNEQEYVTTPLWNVIGVVNGTIPNEVVVIGNHRDAWIAGGAGDPNSGSAVLNEIVRAVGEALDAGWKPLRTIVFASWDGEEYSLIGSTEWVEEYLPWLSAANVAYLNIDVGVRGPNFRVSAAPLLTEIVRDVTTMVQSPNQTIKGQTIADLWSGQASVIGSGSDFTAFQDHAGIPCVDVGFVGDSSDAVYHYHSNYDSFYWMKEFGDKGFRYHKAMAQVLGLLMAKVVETVVLPFSATEYAESLLSYLDSVEAKLEPTTEPLEEEHIAAFRARATSDEVVGNEDAFRRSLSNIRQALATFRVKAGELDEAANTASRDLENGVPWWNLIGKIRLGLAIVRINRRYKFIERQFLFEGGLDDRSWFKHVVFAPGIWTGYSGAVYPGLVESIDAKNYDNGLKWASIIETCVQNAIRSLE